MLVTSKSGAKRARSRSSSGGGGPALVTASAQGVGGCRERGLTAPHSHDVRGVSGQRGGVRLASAVATGKYEVGRAAGLIARCAAAFPPMALPPPSCGDSEPPGSALAVSGIDASEGGGGGSTSAGLVSGGFASPELCRCCCCCCSRGTSSCGPAEPEPETEGFEAGNGCCCCCSCCDAYRNCASPPSASPSDLLSPPS